ncbi:hypothetical protein PCYB_002570, partial [Plasmodium cynomolgi strain B]
QLPCHGTVILWKKQLLYHNWKEKSISQEQESQGQESRILLPQLERNYVETVHEIAVGSLTHEELEKTPSGKISTESARESENSRHFGNTIGKELGSNSVFPLDPKPSYEHKGILNIGKPSQLPENPSRGVSGDQGDKGSYFSTITHTISEFINDVEPAPVLGVSGGMGALYLLLKVFNVLKL